MTPDFPLAKLATPIPEPIPDWPPIDVGDSIRSAAKVAGEADSQGLLLIDGGSVVGAVSASDLLKSLARDEDPVTGLPRSGPLRDWLAGHLRSGTEVSVVFFDLDRFGEINKAYGHTEGDRVLARAADAILQFCDEGDFLARFGGDEFVIGTLKIRTEAETLAAKITEKLAVLGLPGSAGLSGGRRNEPRAEDNLGAMVEELLRLASVDCMETKRDRA